MEPKGRPHQRCAGLRSPRCLGQRSEDCRAWVWVFHTGDEPVIESERCWEGGDTLATYGTRMLSHPLIFSSPFDVAVLFPGLLGDLMKVQLREPQVLRASLILLFFSFWLDRTFSARWFWPWSLCSSRSLQTSTFRPGMRLPTEFSEGVYFLKEVRSPRPPCRRWLHLRGRSSSRKLVLVFKGFSSSNSFLNATLQVYKSQVTPKPAVQNRRSLSDEWSKRSFRPFTCDILMFHVF